MLNIDFELVRLIFEFLFRLEFGVFWVKCWVNVDFNLDLCV